jgi:hypothetical protein
MTTLRKRSPQFPSRSVLGPPLNTGAGEFVDVKRLCGALGVSLATIGNWITKGCPVVRKGRGSQKSLYDLDAVIAWRGGRGNLSQAPSCWSADRTYRREPTSRPHAASQAKAWCHCGAPCARIPGLCGTHYVQWWERALVPTSARIAAAKAKRRRRYAETAHEQLAYLSQWRQRLSDTLADGHIRQRLRANGVPPSAITADLIEAKRVALSRMRRWRGNLSDGYIRNLIARRTGMPSNAVTADLIDTKRSILLVQRLLLKRKK